MRSSETPRMRSRFSPPTVPMRSTSNWSGSVELTKAARIRDIAQSAGWMVLVDDPQGADISTAAQAHLAATITPTHLLAAGYFMGEEMRISYQRPGAETGPRMTDGLISLVDLPGLGLEIDDSALGDPVFTLTPRALAAGAVSS